MVSFLTRAAIDSLPESFFSREQVDALHTLPNLLKLLAARASGLLSLADVGRDAGLPHTS